MQASVKLGIPTANLPISGLEVGGHSNIDSGIYFGWAALRLRTVYPDSTLSVTSGPNHFESNRGGNTDVLGGSAHDIQVYPMVMSIGWNPVYKNERRSVEVHIIHNFEDDFYGAMLNLSILGFIRHERDYDNIDDLVSDIKTDIVVSRQSLARPPYARLRDDGFLTDFTWTTAS